jgi:hypothetical protein
MNKGRKPPPKTNVRHWTTLQLKKGVIVPAFIAGSAILVEVHSSQRSKPCLKKYLGESAFCAGCESHLRQCTLAYQPVYLALTDHAHVPVFHEDMFARLDDYKLHQRVEIGRPGEGENPGLWIRSAGKAKYDSSATAHQGEADICDWLLVLWRMVGVLTGDQIRGCKLHETPREELAPGPKVTAADAEYSAASPDVRAAMNRMFVERAAQGLEPIPFADVVAAMGATRNGDGHK